MSAIDRRPQPAQVEAWDDGGLEALQQCFDVLFSENLTGFRIEELEGALDVAVGDLIYVTSTSVLDTLAIGSAGKVLRSTGSLPVWSTFTIPDTYVQGDVIYASATDTLTALAKNTTATRYLSNTGTDNNPAWALIDLTNGVTGDLPYANLTAATAASKLLGRGDASAGDWQEITLGTNLSMSGTTLNATGGGVDTTGTPANNQIAIFTDADTLEGSADLTFDGTTVSTAADVQLSGGDLISTNTDFLIRTDTADASDNKAIKITGANDSTGFNQDRSAYINFFGNEYAGGLGGRINFGIGNGAAGDLIIWNKSGNQCWRVDGATNQVQFSAGSAGTPVISYLSDSNTGIYFDGADGLLCSTGGSLRLTLNTTSLTSTLPIFGPAGSESAPTFSFSTDTDTGMYSGGDGQIGFTANGTNSVWIQDNGIGLGTSTFGSGSPTNTIILSNGTAPTSSPADSVQLYSTNISAGNASLGLRTETAVQSASTTSDRYLNIKVNGTTYKLLLST